MSDLLALKLPGTDENVTGPEGFTYEGNTQIGPLLGNLIPYIFAFAGMIMFVMFIMAGFTLLTAVGNKEKVAKGSAMMTSSIIGFVIIFVAYWIMQLLEMILGINLGFGGNP